MTISLNLIKIIFNTIDAALKNKILPESECLI